MNNAYKQQLVFATIQMVQQMSESAAYLYDVFEDTRVAQTSKALATSLGDYLEAVKSYAIKEGIV